MKSVFIRITIQILSPVAHFTCAHFLHIRCIHSLFEFLSLEAKQNHSLGSDFKTFIFTLSIPCLLTIFILYNIILSPFFCPFPCLSYLSLVFFFLFDFSSYSYCNSFFSCVSVRTLHFLLR